MYVHVSALHCVKYHTSNNTNGTKRQLGFDCVCVCVCVRVCVRTMYTHVCSVLHTSLTLNEETEKLIELLLGDLYPRRKGKATA